MKQDDWMCEKCSLEKANLIHQEDVPSSVKPVQTVLVLLSTVTLETAGVVWKSYCECAEGAEGNMIIVEIKPH